MLRALGWLLAALVALAGIGVAFTWAPDVPVDALKPRWAGAPSQFIEVGGLQVHVRDEGPREDPLPIVLVHGTSASLHTWEGWVGAIKGTRRVIRFDLPGFGLTGPAANDDYANAAYVRFVGALVDKLGLSRFVIGGNSLGGEVAWSVAAAMPARVDRLVLVDAAGYPQESLTTPQSVPIGFRIARSHAGRWLAQYVLPRRLVESSVRNVYGDPGRVTPNLVDHYVDMTLRAGNRRALGLRMDQRNSADPARIRRLMLPTLILWGRRDRLLPLEFGERFARDIPGARLVVFDDLGHVPQEEDPARTVAEVLKFLGT